MGRYAPLVKAALCGAGTALFVIGVAILIYAAFMRTEVLEVEQIGEAEIRFNPSPAVIRVWVQQPGSQLGYWTDIGADAETQEVIGALRQAIAKQISPTLWDKQIKIHPDGDRAGE